MIELEAWNAHYLVRYVLMFAGNYNDNSNAGVWFRNFNNWNNDNNNYGFRAAV